MILLPLDIRGRLIRVMSIILLLVAKESSWTIVANKAVGWDVLGIFLSITG